MTVFASKHRLLTAVSMTDLLQPFSTKSTKTYSQSLLLSAWPSCVDCALAWPTTGDSCTVWAGVPSAIVGGISPGAAAKMSAASREDVPENANEGCVGVTSETAGKV